MGTTPLDGKLKTEMIIEKEKSDCVESISTACNKTRRWRTRLADQYDDPRNVRAAEKLGKLADDAPNLSNAYWELLRPHFNSGPVHWRECLSKATRQIGFVHNTTSFPFFVRNLIGLLSGPVA